MIKELKVNSVSNWVRDMTVPLRPVKSDQLCYEPEPLLEQFARAGSNSGIISRFREKYPGVYQTFIDDQRRDLLEFIKVYTENHEEVK